MSEYERNKGKLTRLNVPVDDKNNREVFAKELINRDLPKWYHSYWEWLRDEGEDACGVCRIDGKFYKIEMEDVDSDPEYCNVTKNNDGTYSFESYHYNGGAHWTELLEGKLD